MFFPLIAVLKISSWEYFCMLPYFRSGLQFYPTASCMYVAQCLHMQILQASDLSWGIFFLCCFTTTAAATYPIVLSWWVSFLQ